jgi:anti-sigma factor RsiW
MKCERAVARLQRLLDDELPIVQRWWLRRHLSRCADCTTVLEEERAMQPAVRYETAYYCAPPALAVRIMQSLPREAPPPRNRAWFRLPAVGMAGTGMAGALAGIVLMLLVQSGGQDRGGLTNTVIDSHIDSLMANHLTDVLTSNQHTVKPWLSAHIDVSPPVSDFAAEGFPLVGGRVDYIDGHPTAVVVYRHDKHIINLFAWASPGLPGAAPSINHQQGFNVVSWQHAGISYFAVSDVERNQLEKFVHLVMQSAS